MGIRSGAAQKLEAAFAAAFATYFTGDLDFTKSDGSPLFVAAQSVAKLTYPQVCFMCFEAEEQIALTGIYIAPLHICIDTALTERPDDYDSLLNLHDTRVSKVVNLMANLPVLKTLLNAPASGPDNRTVTGFQLYGVGQIFKEQNKPEHNRLCYMQSVQIPFQPI